MAQPYSSKVHATQTESTSTDVRAGVPVPPKIVPPLTHLPESIVVQPYTHECEGNTVWGLLEQLKHDKVAKHLYLTGVPLGEHGMSLVAEMLAQNVTLETLYMNSTGATDASIMLIAIALESNTALKKLSLSDNLITDEGMESLGRCLLRNSTLRALKLGSNNVTKLGRCWGKVSVCKLNLHGNLISNVPRRYIGKRRVSTCKMAPLKKFLNEEQENISIIEKRVLSTSYIHLDKDDMWRLKTINYHNDFRDWLENLIYDHASFKLVLCGVKYDPKCNLKFLNYGYMHLTRNIFQFLFVGTEKYYNFKRARKVLRMFDSLKLDSDPKAEAEED
jgi:hypothetical protein